MATQGIDVVVTGPASNAPALQQASAIAPAIGSSPPNINRTPLPLGADVHRQLLLLAAALLAITVAAARQMMQPDAMNELLRASWLCEVASLACGLMAFAACNAGTGNDTAQTDKARVPATLQATLLTVAVALIAGFGFSLSPPKAATTRQQPEVPARANPGNGSPPALQPAVQHEL